MSKSSSITSNWFSRFSSTTPSQNPDEPLPPFSTSPPSTPKSLKSKPKSGPRPLSLISLPPTSYLSASSNSRGRYSTIIAPSETHGGDSYNMAGALESKSDHHQEAFETIHEMDGDQPQSEMAEMKNPFLDSHSSSGDGGDHEMHYEMESGIDSEVPRGKDIKSTMSESTRHSEPLMRAERGVRGDLEMGGLGTGLGEGRGIRRADLDVGGLGTGFGEGREIKDDHVVRVCGCWEMPRNVFILLVAVKIVVGVLVLVFVLRSRRNDQTN